MSTDHKNQKFCRVPLERDAEFLESIPAEGSVYFRPATTTLVVGDGATPGGIEFVSRQWVIQKIAEANWKAKLEKQIFKFDTETSFKTCNNISNVSVSLNIAPTVFSLNVEIEIM